MRHADEAFVSELAHRGIDVVLACWHEDPEEEIDCPNGPNFSGVSDAAVGDVDAIIAAVRRLPGLATRPIVITGLSRGGGIALLRAAGGRPEPVIAMNPLVIGSAWMRPEIDVDVNQRVNNRMPKSLVMITDDDIFVPPAQQGLPFVAAARAVGAPVQLLHRPTGTHGGFIFDDAIRPWTADRVRDFVYSVSTRV
jgi:acetyl esterase/lipase